MATSVIVMFAKASGSVLPLVMFDPKHEGPWFFLSVAACSNGGNGGGTDKCACDDGGVSIVFDWGLESKLSYGGLSIRDA